MKTTRIIILVAIAIAAMFISCKKEDVKETLDINSEINEGNVAYIVNYGAYGFGNGEISIYDTEGESITQDAYFTANSVAFSSNIQSVAIHDDIAYFMSNNGDKIDIVDAKTMTASANPISTNIIKPRYFVATGNTAYISCWGDVVDWSVMANSYIAKMDLSTNTVTKIALAGGPEGVVIIGNKLYVALTTMKKVAVVDLSTEAVSYIDVPAIPYHFVVDANGYLWSSIVSTWLVPVGAESLGLVQINPNDNTVMATVNFSEIGANGYINISKDKNTIYVMGNEAWPGTISSIYSIDVPTKTLSSNALISGANYYGFGVNHEDDNIYVLISPDATLNGSLEIYNSEGGLLDTENTGVAPQHVVFYDIEK